MSQENKLHYWPNIKCSIMVDESYTPLMVKYKKQSGFCIIHISLIRLMKGSKVWTFERPRMWTIYIFEPLKAHSYEPNICLIRLMQGQIRRGPRGLGPPTTKNEAPAPKFYKIEAPEWQF